MAAEVSVVERCVEIAALLVLDRARRHFRLDRIGRAEATAEVMACLERHISRKRLEAKLGGISGALVTS